MDDEETAVGAANFLNAICEARDGRAAATIPIIILAQFLNSSSYPLDAIASSAMDHRSLNQENA